MYAGDWILDLLGATMVVGSGVTVVGGTAILFGLVQAIIGVDGTARARSFPPGVALHAEEVQGRIRSRYMLRTRQLTDPAASHYVAFEVEATDRTAFLIAEAATMPITRLPRLNESLRRALAARAPRAAEPSEPVTKRPRRKARRKQKLTRTRTAARS